MLSVTVTACLQIMGLFKICDSFLGKLVLVHHVLCAWSAGVLILLRAVRFPFPMFSPWLGRGNPVPFCCCSLPSEQAGMN